MLVTQYVSNIANACTEKEKKANEYCAKGGNLVYILRP